MKFRIETVTPHDEGSVLAFVDLALETPDGELRIKGAKVLRGRDGARFALPSSRKDGRWVDVLELPWQVHQEVAEAALDRFHEITGDRYV